ncbi:uncharacterized protein LOC111244869 isoform X3 [Varroa destructor]|uniref:Uncharacterized protein n=1 Tax=Varroa destructor TaxID=109461 RepID=A0A7M7M4E6_VARDE|nr:uncharacterized protein LOC111244869 isoform X3 [Varroa destructor]
MSVAVATSETVAPAAATLSKVLCSGAMRNATAQVLAAAHAQIQEMHANSGSRAVGYVIVVLLLYALALAVVLIKYVRQERYEARLYHIYDEFVRRDRFLRLSKRHSSAGHSGVTSTTNCEEMPPLQFPHPGTLTSGSALSPGASGGVPYCGPSGAKTPPGPAGTTGPLRIPHIHLPASKIRNPHPLSDEEGDDDGPIQLFRSLYDIEAGYLCLGQASGSYVRFRSSFLPTGSLLQPFRRQLFQEELLGVRASIPVRVEDSQRQLDSTV